MPSYAIEINIPRMYEVVIEATDPNKASYAASELLYNVLGLDPDGLESPPCEIAVPREIKILPGEPSLSVFDLDNQVYLFEEDPMPAEDLQDYARAVASEEAIPFVPFGSKRQLQPKTPTIEAPESTTASAHSLLPVYTPDQRPTLGKDRPLSTLPNGYTPADAKIVKRAQRPGWLTNPAPSVPAPRTDWEDDWDDEYLDDDPDLFDDEDDYWDGCW